MQSAEKNKTTTSRPSLLSISNEENASNNRILSNFETSLSGQKKPAVSSGLHPGRRLVLVAILVMLAVGATLIGGFNSLGQTGKLEAATSPSLLPVAAASASSSSYTPISGQQADAEPARSAATIITELVEQEPSAQLGTAGAHLNAGLASKVLEQQSTIASANDAGRQTGNVSSPEKNRPASTADAGSATHASMMANGSRQNRDAGKNGQQKSVKPINGSGKETPDRDVAVLTALMTDSSDGKNAAPVSPVKTEPRAAKKGVPHAKSKSQQTAAATRTESEPGRDIVERRPNDSSETLLHRCQQLGFIEGQLCRWRICSGRWESDAACKASAGRS